ncbi:MAG: hypothetical protein RL356_912, partial [Actinomycetota bacterium]
MLTFSRFPRKLSKQRLSLLGALKSNTIGLFSKKDFLIIAFFTLLGAGGIFAATLITITTPDSQGAAYTAATACDENVTVTALTASDAATGQLYVATIALSDVDQTPLTGCGYRNAEVALKINGQMSYASWTIVPSTTSDTFSFTSATASISDRYARTSLTPFQADGLTNVAVKMSGNGYLVGDIGPGGGRVFYASTTGFNCGPSYTTTGSPYSGKCYYLEAAPTTGASAWTDAGYAWSGDTTTAVNNASAPETATATAIGWGYRNTLAMVLQDATANKAGTISRAYRGPNNLSDWYLPSKDELNQMCKWARGVAWTSDATVCTGGTINTGPGAAGFVIYAYYISSSEYIPQPADRVWIQPFTH